MSLYFKLFVTIVILTIVGNSKADIPNCDYFDTVDISDLIRVNDTYIYQGIEIPSNLIAKYNYRKLRYGATEPVKTHLRACVCKLMPCVPICCPRKNMLANGKCDDGFNQEITLKMEGWTTKHFRMKDQFDLCDEIHSINNNDYEMWKDGSLIFHSTKKILSKERYCLYPQFNSKSSDSIWVVRHACTEELLPATIEIRAISTIFYILTLVVYLYVNKLRNDLGKCLISTIFCWLILNVLYILDTYNLLNRICLLAGYSRYFIAIATNLWLSVISFHLWVLLTNRNEPSSFGTYSAFAWSLAAIPTGVIYLVNLIWEKDLHKWNWLPLVGYAKCWLEARGPSYWIFFKGPVLTLTLLNIIMFVLTVVHIWKVKSELRKFKRDEERTIQCINFDTETFLMFLRLSVIMGTFWILDLFYFLQNFSIIQQVWFFVVYMENSLGIIVCMLLILKSRTLKLLMESKIRGR